MSGDFVILDQSVAPKNGRPLIRQQMVRAMAYMAAGVALTGALILVEVIAGMAGPWPILGAWALLCAVAAARRHALAWATLVVAPLMLLCIQWVGSGFPVRYPDQDPFGFQFVTIFAFMCVALVTAASGVVFILAVACEGSWPLRNKGLPAQ